MNARNLKYIRPYNLSGSKRLADDKLYSKEVMKKAGLPVPKLITRIRSRNELDDFDFGSLPNSFVLKPNFGFGGEGILVVYGRRKDQDNVWVKADRKIITENDLKTQIGNILDGSFSRTNTPDIAFFEERIMLSKDFKPYTYKGIPDIRVIVFNRVPVMAMLRIPTELSGGTSNMHMGGIGVGIDMATGVTTSAIQFDRSVEYVPNKRLLLSGVKIPYWDDILNYAVKAQDVSGLGYLGADIAIDRERGPVFMELNARPGLSIQNANEEGLLGRLRRVEGLKVKTIKRAIALAQNLFGGEIEGEIEDMSGKKIIRTIEKIKLTGKNGKELEIEAKIDTGAHSTSIDKDVAIKLGFSDVIDYFDKIEKPKDITRKTGRTIKKEIRKKYLEKHRDLQDIGIIYSPSGATIRPKIILNYVMDRRKVVSRANIVRRTDLKYPMIIGRRDLKRFMVEIQ
ncbi:MAG: sugar-transfer associated ATP-grasp domain-containing protein [Patescibacteria group bacterium]|nr:sugar-transfer associated ATP-grasp domain-containing protein [Patescibacteria group bacterium]